MTLGEYASHEIEARRQRLSEAAVAALESPEVEAVHRVRTSWRRLEAAVSLVPALPDPREWEGLRRCFKKVMSLSGELRDRDNALVRFAHDANLTLALRGQRGLWETPFRQALARSIPLELTLARNDSRDATSAAADLITRSREKLQKQQKRLRGQDDPQRWHKFRIAAKRHRYALEFFQNLPGEDYAASLDRYKAVQDVLGALQDLSAAADVARAAAGDAALIREPLRALKRERRAMLALLSVESFSSDGSA